MDPRWRERGGPPAWLPAVPLAAVALVLQLGGSLGRAARDGTQVGWGGVLLLVAGPLSIALLSRFPLVPLGVSISAALAYVATGEPVGPVFAAPVAALLVEGIRRRRERFSRVRDERRDRVERARSEERIAMARDLHDTLGHSLTLINVQSGAALHAFDRDPDNARQALATVKAESHRALEEVRRVLDAVRDPGAAAAVRPGPALTDVADLVAADPGFGWQVDGLADVGALPAAVDAAAYRVVQEAMTNVRRHSGARGARIMLSRNESGLVVEVVDPGRQGAAVETGETSGTGLVGMRERVERLGGTLESGATGSGHRVRAVFPLSGGGGGR
ncbi:sensor histidine kinase [Phycicoccus sonneratiae]|uniref:histidine kinase n=1 Tax=Phycicoccus sonneratiae TaxID=2807628 RepID=A0ABS2CMM8_9MICO|nr:sensor histidine kinase [Phycicoccus sonneraticus]MBM6401137.1 sensor histidine kinase [Phycicoccus sonneraticus]